MLKFQLTVPRTLSATELAHVNTKPLLLLLLLPQMAECSSPCKKMSKRSHQCARICQPFQAATPWTEPQELLVELKPGMARGAGHSSRVFSVKFHPDDSNTIVSGGWVSNLESKPTGVKTSPSPRPLCCICWSPPSPPAAGALKTDTNSQEYEYSVCRAGRSSISARQHPDEFHSFWP